MDAESQTHNHRSQTSIPNRRSSTVELHDRVDNCTTEGLQP